MNLGNYPRDDFGHRIRRLFATGISRRIQLAERHLSHKINGARYWADHLQRYIEGLRNALTGNDFLMPADIDNLTSETREDFKHIVHLFGRLLYRWPDIYKAMDSFNQDEIFEYITRFDKDKVQ